MNNQLQEFARQTIKDGLSKLPEDWQRKFKLMYGKESMSIEEVVEKMDESKLDWAMQQVEKSLAKLA